METVPSVNSKSLNNNLPIGSRWRGLSITHEQLDQAIDSMTRWWWGGESPGIILAGSTGAGKTSMADIVLGWAIARNIPAKMFNEPELLETIRESYSRDQRHFVKRIAETPLLILDDVGAGHFSAGNKQWYEEIYWMLLDGRNAPGYRTLITTNLMPDKLSRRIGERADSRLREIVLPSFYRLMFDVPDYRRNRNMQPATFSTMPALVAA